MAGILLPLSILFFTTPERDESYQALAALNYKQSPLAPLSYFIGYIWFKFFGETILNLRVLQLICHIVAIGLGCRFFLRKTSDKLWTAILFMTLTTASQVWAMHIYNWDTGCYPFAMLYFLATIAFWEHPVLKTTLWLAAASTALSLARIPCAACIPLTAIIVIWRYKHCIFKKGFPYMILYLAVTTSLCILFLLTIYGGISGVEQVFSPENIITGHGPDAIERYIDRVKVILPQLSAESILPLYCMVWAYVAVNLRVNRIKAMIIMLAGMEALLLVLTYIMHVHTFFCLLFVPFIFLWLYPSFNSLRHTGKFGTIGYEKWLTLLIVCIPIIGSDGFLERFMVLPTLPVVATFTYGDRALNRFIKAFIVTTFIAASSMLCVKDIFYISQGIHHVGDKLPRLRGILVKDESAINLESQAATIAQLRKEGLKIAVIGDSRYAGAFTFDLDMLPDLHIFHLGTLAEDLPKFKSRIDKFDALMVFYPVYYMQDAINCTVNQTDNDNFEQYLLSEGFEKSTVTYPNYVIYMRPEKITKKADSIFGTSSLHDNIK